MNKNISAFKMVIVLLRYFPININKKKDMNRHSEFVVVGWF